MCFTLKMTSNNNNNNNVFYWIQLVKNNMKW